MLRVEGSTKLGCRGLGSVHSPGKAHSRPVLEQPAEKPFCDGLILVGNIKGRVVPGVAGHSELGGPAGLRGVGGGLEGADEVLGRARHGGQRRAGAEHTVEKLMGGRIWESTRSGTSRAGRTVGRLDASVPWNERGPPAFVQPLPPPGRSLVDDPPI